MKCLSRRAFMGIAGVGVSSWMGRRPLVAYSKPLEVSRKKLLFWDLARLDYWHNLELAQGKPVYHAEASYVDPTALRRPVVFPSVWRDTSTGRWRMVYSSKWSPFTLMAAESEDGLQWKPLPVPDATPTGGKLAPHHLFTFEDGQGSGVYFDPVAADGFAFKIFGRQGGETVARRAAADPQHPWHAIAKAEGGKRYISEAITLVSRDGLHWEIKAEGNWARADWAPEPPVFAFHRAGDRRHALTARPGWGDRRVCLRVTRDFKKWQDPELLLQPDPLDDQAPLGFYGMPVFPYGPGYVGLLWIFHNASSEPVNSFNQFFGDMDAQLAFSYDGRHFFRGKREPFLERNPVPEHGCTQIRPCSLVVTEHDIRIYSEAHRAAHGREGAFQKGHPEPVSAMTLHTLRRDGFMYLRSRGDWGRFQTKPFLLQDPMLRLNADARFGEVQFQLTDIKSQPLPGLSFSDCEAMRGEDALSRPLRWKNVSLESCVGRAVRLEMKFRQAEVYALEGSWHFMDAQDWWMLEDNKRITPMLFDH